MKKSLIVFLVLAITAALAMPALAAPATDTLDIPVHKAVSKPVIDGKVTAEEWGEAVIHEEPGVGYTIYADNLTKTHEQGVKADVYMLWDETGYYVAAVVEDPVHFNQYSGADNWNGDAFEFDSNFNKDDYPDRNRNTIALNNDGEICGGNYRIAEGVNWDGSECQFTEYKITRSGTTTTYELYVKWENICPDGASFAKVGNVFRGNVQFHLAYDGDYLECQRYAVYDDASETFTFPNFILSEAVSAVQSDPEPVEAVSSEANQQEQPTEAAVQPSPAAPQTGDGMAVPAAMILTALTAGIFTVCKKRKTI